MSGNRRLELEHRARDTHLGITGELGEQLLSEPFARTADHHIGLPDEPLRRQREVDQCRGVDQIDGRAERHTEGDGEHGDREPQRLLAYLRSQQNAPHGPPAGRTSRRHQPPVASGASPRASSR